MTDLNYAPITKLYVNIHELAGMMGISEDTIQAMVESSTLPPPIDHRRRPWQWSVDTLNRFHWRQARLWLSFKDKALSHAIPCGPD